MSSAAAPSSAREQLARALAVGEEVVRADRPRPAFARKRLGAGRGGALQERRHVGAVEIGDLVGQVEQVALAGDHGALRRDLDQRLQQHRAQMLAAVPPAEGLGHRDGERPARLDHPAARDQPLALRGGDEVDLVLGGQHVAAGRHQAVGGVAAGAIQHRADQRAVEEALLLGQARIGRRLEHAAPGGDLDQLDPERPASGPAARSSP